MATWRTADKQSCRVPPTCQHGAVKVTADDIAQLLASPPPRRVPAHVAKAIKGGKGVWFTVLFGLFFGSFGMIFVWIFFPWRLGDEWQLRGGGAREVSGHVREVSATSMSVNEQRVYEYRFAYTPEDGTPRSAVCFATGRDWAGGREVPVRYLPARPQVALIEGASLNQGGMFGAFTIIFPLIGYGMAIGSLVLRGNPTRLLREGAVAEVDVLACGAETAALRALRPAQARADGFPRGAARAVTNTERSWLLRCRAGSLTPPVYAGGNTPEAGSAIPPYSKDPQGKPRGIDQARHARTPITHVAS
jgi:hypothetical protein